MSQQTLQMELTKVNGQTMFALVKPRRELTYQELKERYFRLQQKRRNQSVALKRLQRAHKETLNDLEAERKRNERLVRSEIRAIIRDF